MSRNIQCLLYAVLFTYVHIGDSSPTIRIGGIIPMTGRQSIQGQYLELGYLMGINEVNEKGGVYIASLNRNISIELLFRDSMSDKAKAAEVMDDIVQEFNPVAFLSDYGASRSFVLCHRANEIHIPIVNCGAPTNIFDNNAYGFGLLSSISQLGKTTMLFLKQKIDENILPKPFRITLGWEDAPHGYDYRDAVEEVVQQYPETFEIVYRSSFEYPNDYSSPEDFEQFVKDMHNAGALQADGLLIDAHSSDFVLIHQALTEYDYDFKFITYGARGADQSDKERILNYPTSTGGIVAAQWWNPSIRNEHSVAFLQKWRQTQFNNWIDRIDSNPDALESRFATACEQNTVQWYGAVAYESARVLVDAIRRANSLNATAIRNALAETNFTQSILTGGVVQFQRQTPEGYTSPLGGTTLNQMNNEFALVQNLMDNQPNNYSYTLYPESEKSGEFVVLSPWRTRRKSCGYSDIASSVSKCNHHNNHHVTYFYLDRYGDPCIDSEGNESLERCWCVGGVELPLEEWIPCDHVISGSKDASVIIGMSLFGFVVVLIITILMVMRRKSASIRVGQPIFLQVMCLACMVLSLTGILFVGENTNALCTSRIVIPMLALASLLASLAVKTYRIHKILQAKLRSVIIKWQEMMVVLVLILLLGALILGLWVGLDPPVAVNSNHVVPSVGGVVVEYNETICQYSSTVAYPTVTGLYLGLILLICNIISFQGRNSDSKFMESASITFASYNLTLFATLIFCFLSFIDMSSVQQVVLITVGLVLTSTIFVIGIVGPKLLYAYGYMNDTTNSSNTGVQHTADIASQQNSSKLDSPKVVSFSQHDKTQSLTKV